MALLGVILLLLGVAVGVVAYVATHAATAVVPVTALGLTRNASPLELVLYGVVAMLLFALGWALLSAAARRRVRVRREEKERARIAEIEEGAEATRREHEDRLREAGLRDEDLRRRENELAARHEGLDTREAELADRESRLREQPSVADVVTGRAEGSVHEGTASWRQSGDDTGEDTHDDTSHIGSADGDTAHSDTAYGDDRGDTAYGSDHADRASEHTDSTAAEERQQRDSSV
ncbi:hypothetical protein [Terrabacter sp. BE26]|uniref:hypothetical protein n=1 Tax=Terrabacter sp. BE26 TaxID=2898152 RepID=UPI0035BE74E0